MTLPRDAASNESMAIEEERTGFEWLDRPFMMTRIWLTLLGLFLLTLFAYQTIYILMFVRLGPPAEESETLRTHCWGERRPLRELRELAMISNLLASSVILVWRRPRMGFLIAAVGGIPLWALLGLLPAAWLCYAAWKVGPSNPSPAAGTGTS